MTKKLNKHTPSSDELFEKLRSGDSGGLDDFEKEAFEGFASLENTELAEKLNKELDKKIEETYFKKPAERSKFAYYAMAAGLVLVIGLSVLFFNNTAKQEDSLAYVPETTQSVTAADDGKPEEISAQGNPVTGAKSAEAVEAEPKADPAASQAPPAPPTEKAIADKLTKELNPAKDEEDRRTNELSPRMVVKGPDTKSPSSPVVTEEQKQQNEGASGKGATGGLSDAENKKGERKERERDDQQPMDKDANLAASENKPATKNDEAEKTKAKKSTAKTQTTEKPNGYAQSAPAGNMDVVTKSTPERAKESAAEQNKLEEVHVETAATGSGAIAGDAKANVSLRRSSFFKTAKFNNHVDYIKAEINKNESLKNNIMAYQKAFRIDLTVSEKGKVSDVKADLPDSKCSGCKTEIEKIIINMPNWEPAQNSNGTAVKQTFFFNYKY